MSLNPWLTMAIVTLVLLALFAGLRAYQTRYSPHPEFVRKLLHIMMGSITLTFPWLFNETWPVVTLAASTIIGLWVLKNYKAMRQQWGDVLHGVSRNSLGEIYFPAAVALLFVLADGNALLFCIPILILTLADALAALIGVRYGQVKYKTSEGSKSLEGSLAFFTVAFLSVHIPLLLFSDVGRTESLLIALIMGILVMLFEAIAWRGLDNLFIPLGSFILLKTYLPMDTDSLILKLFVLALLLVGFYLIRRKTTLDDSAILGLVLIAYVTWSVESWLWLLAPCTVFIAYVLFNLNANTRVERTHSIQAVVCVGMPSLMVLFLARGLDQPQLLYPYTLAYAVQLTLIGLARIKFDHAEFNNTRILLQASFQGWILLLIPLTIIAFTLGAIYYALIAAVLIFLSAYLFLHWQPQMQDCPTDNARWWRQGSIAISAALISSVPLYLFGEI